MIRKPAAAGYFYPSEPGELMGMIKKYLSESDTAEGGIPKALVVPHAGYVYSGLCAASGYSIVKDYEKVVILGPSHFVPFYGAAFSPHDYWETPLGKVKVENFESDFFFIDEEAHRREHSIEVQLPFLQAVLKDFAITPICLGEADPKNIAHALMPHIGGALVIASSDLSHYHPYEEAIKLDGKANESIPSLDIRAAENIEACGLAAVLVLMYMAKKLGLRGKKLCYYNSGDVTGDRNSVVGYGCYGFF